MYGNRNKKFFIESMSCFPSEVISKGMILMVTFLHDMKGSDVPAVIGWENIVNLFIEINLIACFFPFEIHL